MDFTEHRMPDGERVFYRERDHTYWQSVEPKKRGAPDGDWKGCGRLTGVTTVVQPFDFQPSALMRWAAKTNGIGVALLAADALELDDADAMRSELAWLASQESIWQALAEAQLTYDDLRDEASDRGTNVHEHALFALATGAHGPAWGELSDAERGYARGVSEFWLAHDPRTLQAEQVVCDVSLGLAGRFDWRGVLARCGDPECGCAGVDGGVALLDCKTSGFIGNKDHVQVAGYEFLARRRGFVGAADALLILQVDEAGGYQLIPVAANADDFLLAVSVYRRAAEISKTMGAYRKAREAQAA